MSRIDTAGSNALALDLVPDEVPTPARPPSHPPTPAARERNAVQPFKEPTSKSPSPPKPASMSRDTGPTVSAGELTALGGRLRARGAEVPADVYRDLQSRLTRSLGDWTVSDADVRAVHTLLGQLPPDGYRATLERMEREGLLKTFLAEQTPEARASFLEQAHAKGTLQRLAGEPESGPLGYPGRPAFFRDDMSLPDSLRQAVSEHAVTAGRTYLADHAAYLGRYVQAVEQSQGLPELRKLGPPREARLSDSMLGLSREDPRREALAKEWRLAVGTAGSTGWVYQAINARQRELLGERPGGTFSLNGKAELQHDHLLVGGEARLDSRGRVDLKSSGGVALKGGPVGLEVTRDSKGQLQSEVKVDLGLFSVSHSSDGDLKLSVGVGKHAGSYSKLNLREAEFGGGVFVDVKGQGNKAELRLGYEMKGLTAKRATEAVDRQHVGLFDTPPELARGVAWEALPESKRERYLRNGWNREEWSRARGT
ncbi:hypothetical protein [Myxococcus faecalis]|uniref:hypothetical protein n=1 Tax=Myxococcus faecalis TaxID=3115646 RepID=UPI003CF83AB2